MKIQTPIDINNSEEEFKKIDARLSLLSSRFLAISMDYKHYIDHNLSEHKIYELRDGVLYRFFSSRTHLGLLLRQHDIIESRIKDDVKNGSPMFYVENYHQEVSAIFDSIIYHTVSIFDYLSTLANYISLKSQDTLMWTQFLRSIRDPNNQLSSTKYAATVDLVAREFVDKLYDHRSLLIHKKGDLGNYNISYTLGGNDSVEIFFLAGSKLTKKFKELKEISVDNQITTRFVTFWILNKTIDKVTDILFSLKEEIKTNRKIETPMMFYLNPLTKEQQPISVNYWHEDEYLNRQK